MKLNQFNDNIKLILKQITHFLMRLFLFIFLFNCNSIYLIKKIDFLND